MSYSVDKNQSSGGGNDSSAQNMKGTPITINISSNLSITRYNCSIPMLNGTYNENLSKISVVHCYLVVLPIFQSEINQWQHRRAAISIICIEFYPFNWFV